MENNPNISLAADVLLFQNSEEEEEERNWLRPIVPDVAMHVCACMLILDSFDDCEWLTSWTDFGELEPSDSADHVATQFWKTCDLDYTGHHNLFFTFI